MLLQSWVVQQNREARRSVAIYFEHYALSELCSKVRDQGLGAADHLDLGGTTVMLT
jgi:hypothetical protein